jgi:hypothetical protein
MFVGRRSDDSKWTEKISGIIFERRIVIIGNFSDRRQLKNKTT